MKKKLLHQNQLSLQAIDDLLVLQKMDLQKIQSRLGTKDERQNDFEKANDLAHDLINNQFLRNLKAG